MQYVELRIFTFRNTFPLHQTRREGYFSLYNLETMPQFSLSLLGGADEIGANCCYLNLDGTGVIIDAGLHPRKRDADCFPAVESIGDLPADLVILTHAHTDHVGALPYLLHHVPHLRIVATRPTADLLGIMLKNTMKLLRVQTPVGVDLADLSHYNTETLDTIAAMTEFYPYLEPFDATGQLAVHHVAGGFHDAGHILGSAGVALECAGFRIFHTGDCCFGRQMLLTGAKFPRTHADVLIVECTNGADVNPIPREEQTAQFVRFINSISNANGSVLIPCFALGKTQEILTLLHELMHKGRIPRMPIYSGGMSRAISAVYDRNCYLPGRAEPGFEISDIPQIPLNETTLDEAQFLKTPSVVVASSGMMNTGTTSHRLAAESFWRRNFGIAFVGWQEPSSPGFAALHSTENQPFDFGGRSVKRVCSIGKMRFSAHAEQAAMMEFITDVKPKTLVLMHGEPDACNAVAAATLEMLPHTRVIIPRKGAFYRLN